MTYLVNGITSYQTSIYGARADIETNIPTLCSASGGSPSLSGAWAMVTPSQSYHWAQSGYIKVGSEHPEWGANHAGTHYVAQHTSACNPTCSPQQDPTRTAFGAVPSGTIRYSSYLRASDDRIHMTADGSDLLIMNYDTTGEWDTDWRVQVGGETQHLNSDMPGTNSDRTGLNQIMRYEANGDINFVQVLNPYPATLPSRYNRAIGDSSFGGKYLQVWTDIP